LQELVSTGHLTKFARGLYYAPRESVFGPVPPADEDLVAAFLKDRNFLLFSPSAYNAAGLGTTQFYNATWVYNHKRHGVFTLGNRQYDFRQLLNLIADERRVDPARLSKTAWVPGWRMVAWRRISGSSDSGQTCRQPSPDPRSGVA
jgi:hypothetical protein